MFAIGSKVQVQPHTRYQTAGATGETLVNPTPINRKGGQVCIISAAFDNGPYPDTYEVTDKDGRIVGEFTADELK